VEGRVEHQRRHRRQRHRHRPEQPGRAVRVDVAAAPGRRPDDRRRAGERGLQVDQRRPDVDQAHEGPAGRRHGPHLARRRSEGEADAHLRAHQRAAAGNGLLPIG
jgi:hypothetical protein